MRSIAFAAALSVVSLSVLSLSASAVAAQPAPPISGASPAPASTPAKGDASIALTFEPGAETGAVMVALYSSAETYSGGAPAAMARLDVAAGERTARFADLPAGDYAVKAFHDVDGDGKMNTNPFGMPTEPFAFSNNARGNMGPANWDRAHFAVSGAVAQTIAIR